MKTTTNPHHGEPLLPLPKDWGGILDSSGRPDYSNYYKSGRQGDYFRDTEEWYETKAPVWYRQRWDLTGTPWCGCCGSYSKTSSGPGSWVDFVCPNGCKGG